MGGEEAVERVAGPAETERTGKPGRSRRVIDKPARILGGAD
jgi:hypothetical protein